MRERPILEKIPHDEVQETPYPTLKDQVLRRLREDILSGYYHPEQTLNINELCQRYQVSRTPIREAVNSLASMGLLSVSNYRSIRVARFLSDEVHEIYYMRAAISGLSARLAAEYMGQEDIDYLRHCLEKLAEAIERNDNDLFMEYNRYFHRRIEEQIKTGIITNFSEQLYLITGRYRQLGHQVRSNADNLKEHQHIFDAIVARDPDRADYHGRLHYSRTMDLLSGSLLESTGGDGE